MTIDYLYDNWQLLTIKNTGVLTQPAAVQHHASQLLAMIGRHLIKQEPDDSNTNMAWIPKKNVLAGNIIQANPVIRFGIDIVNLKLHMFYEGLEEFSSYNLINKNINDAFEWIKNQVSKFGVDKKLLKKELHYEIASNKDIEGKKFSINNKSYFEELAKYRTNANMMLEYFINDFELSSEIKVWPHHFDTGTVITIEQSNTGEITKSVGLGLAIADDHIKEPYFYINHYSSKGNINYNDLPVLGYSGEWHSDGWTGLVLKLSDIANKKNSEEQVIMTCDFIREGIEVSIKLLD